MAPGEKSAYHHGDLRAALIREGLRLLEEREADAIALREVARAAGVSATAVYRHFPDKAALLRALSAEGLDRLAAAQNEDDDGGERGFLAIGRAYVRFALANPALFRLVFSSPPERDVLTSAPGNVPEAFRMLLESAVSLLPPGAPPEAVAHTALEGWAKVHGLAMLMLDGQVPGSAALVDAVLGEA